MCLSTEQLSRLVPSNCPHLLLQAMAGPLAAATAATVTNPMDVVRARVQVMYICTCTYTHLLQTAAGALQLHITNYTTNLSLNACFKQIIS